MAHDIACPNCLRIYRIGDAAYGQPATCTNCGTIFTMGAAPAAEPRLWYMAANGQRFGPYTPSEMAAYASQGRVTPQTPVWRHGLPDWTPAGDVDFTVPI